MSAQSQSLSAVRALADKSLGDPETSQHFLQAFGITPQAFTVLDEQAQAMHLQQQVTHKDAKNAIKRYALASQGSEAGLVWSVGGVWSASLIDQEPDLMTGPEVDAFHKKHPNAQVVDVLVYREALKAYNAGFDSVLDHSERSTPESRIAARDAGIKSLVRAGFPADALDVGRNEVRGPGNVSSAAFKHGTKVLARGVANSKILFAIGEVDAIEGDDPKSEIINVKLKQVMKPLSLTGEEPSFQRFFHVSKAAVGEHAFFKRADVVEISPLHLPRVLGMKTSALVEQIATQGLGSVAPVPPPVPDKARIDMFSKTTHSICMQWRWDSALLHSGGYKGQVVGAVADAAAAAEVKFSGVLCFFGDENEYPMVSLTGSDLSEVQAAAKEVAHVLLSFEGVEPVTGRPQKDVAKVSAPDYVFGVRMQKALSRAIGVIHPNSQASRLVVEEAIAAPLSEVRQRWNAVLTAWPFVRSAYFDDGDPSLKAEFQGIYDEGVASMNAELAAPAKVQDDSPSPV